MKLRPVAFRYKEDPADLVNYGLIAEELAEVYPDLVANDSDGRPQAIRYHELNALLLNELQKQHHTVETQERKIRQQESAIEELRSRLADLERQIRSEKGD
jgi:glutathione S-transferase